MKPVIWECLTHTLLFVAVLWFAHVFFQSPPQPHSVVVTAGDTLSIVPQITGFDQEPQLLLAISPYCPYSMLSMPFYKDLVAARNSRNIRMQVIAVVDTSISVALQKRRLVHDGVSVDSVVALPFRALNIHGVPLSFT